jgi:hypothetical protein
VFLAAEQVEGHPREVARELRAQRIRHRGHLVVVEDAG